MVQVQVGLLGVIPVEGLQVAAQKMEVELAKRQVQAVKEPWDGVEVAVWQSAEDCH